MTISPLTAAALRVINAAWLNGTSYDLASQAAYALESAQMLQSPETAAETERLRARVTELVARPSREAVREVADAIDAALIAEPQQSSAVVLHDLLIKARRLLPCTCARSGGLHEQSCLRYVPGHELISPALALKAYRAERPAAASGPTEVERLRARGAELENPAPPAEYPPALPWARLMDAEDRADFLDELAAAAITHADSKTALAAVEDTCARWRAIAEAQHAHNTAPGPDAQEPEHAAPCRWPSSPNCACAGPVPYALTPQATSALALSTKAGA